jgi:hypothetical protein
VKEAWGKIIENINESLEFDKIKHGTINLILMASDKQDKENATDIFNILGDTTEIWENKKRVEVPFLNRSDFDELFINLHGAYDWNIYIHTMPKNSSDMRNKWNKLKTFNEGISNTIWKGKVNIQFFSNKAQLKGWGVDKASKVYGIEDA